MKITRAALIAVIFVLTACVPDATPKTAQPAIMQIISLTSTPTIEPSATIGYQETSEAAQATSESAQREAIGYRETTVASLAQVAQATSDHEAREQERLKMTVEASRMTEQAAATVVPLTMTAQAQENARFLGQSTITAGMMTATFEAPTHIAAVAKADAEKKFAGVNALAGAVGKILLGIAAVFFGLAMLWAVKGRAEPAIEAAEDVNEAAPVVHQFTQATPNQVFERNPPLTDMERQTIARAIKNGARLTFRDMTPEYFTDPRWREVRILLTASGPDGSRYAIVNGDGTLDLTPIGYEYLEISPPLSGEIA